MAELQASMSSSEFVRWVAYYRMNPFGDDRADWRIAQLTALTASINSKRQFKPADFMFKAEPSNNEAKAMLDAAKNTLAAAGLLNGVGPKSKDT